MDHDGGDHDFRWRGKEDRQTVDGFLTQISVEEERVASLPDTKQQRERGKRLDQRKLIGPCTGMPVPCTANSCFIHKCDMSHTDGNSASMTRCGPHLGELY